MTDKDLIIRRQQMELNSLRSKVLNDYRHKVVVEAISKFVQERNCTTKEVTVFEFQSRVDENLPLYKSI